MARLIVILVLLIVASMAIEAMLRQARHVMAQMTDQMAGQAAPQEEGRQMPKIVNTMAFVAWMVLTITAATGGLAGF